MTRRFVLGNSLGDGLSFNQGVVSVREEVVSFGGGNRPVLRISNALNGGDSGAPVFNKSKDFLGLVQGRKTLNDTSVVYGVGYALPGSIVNALYKKSLTVDATKKIKYPSVSYATVETTENNIKSTYPTVTISSESVSYTFARKDDGLYLDYIVGSTAVNKGV